MEDKRKLCPHCGKPLRKSKVDGYAYECVSCDEDFYSFEVIDEKAETTSH